MLTLVRHALRDIRQTGTVCPSGPTLVRAMTRSVAEATGRIHVLDVGPGSGVFTKRLLAALKPGDSMHIVEVNEGFCERIESLLVKPFRASNPDIKVELTCSPIQTARLDGPFDHIVCGLPFNNFPPKKVREIFRRLFDEMASDGDLLYYEYAGVRKMKAPLSKPDARRDLREIDSLGKILRRRHGGQRELVLPNVPPAYAIRLTR